MTRKTNAAGVALIKRWEALRLNAYLCPAGVPTIGYGHTGDVKLGDKITEHQADVILGLDLEAFERYVERATAGVTLTDNEFAACVSLSFNIGQGNFGKSTLLRKLKAGAPRGEIVAEFGKHVFARDGAGGKFVQLPGLVKRRSAEAQLFASVGA